MYLDEVVPFVDCVCPLPNKTIFKPDKYDKDFKVMRPNLMPYLLFMYNTLPRVILWHLILRNTLTGGQYDHEVKYRSTTI